MNTNTVRFLHGLDNAVIYCSVPRLQSPPAKVVSGVPRSEPSVAANQHSISQYSLQCGDSREALVSGGRAERAGRIVADCYHYLSERRGVVGA